MLGIWEVLNKTELEDDPETFTFSLMQLFDKTQPRGPTGLSKAQKGVCFQVRKIKVANLGLLHKKRLEDNLKIFTFGLMQLFDLTQPGGPAGLSKPQKGAHYQVCKIKVENLGCLASYKT